MLGKPEFCKCLLYFSMPQYCWKFICYLTMLYPPFYVIHVQWNLYIKITLRDQQNVVLIHKWSLYADSIAWKVYTWGSVQCGLYKAGVFIYRWSFEQVWLLRGLCIQVVFWAALTVLYLCVFSDAAEHGRAVWRPCRNTGSGIFEYSNGPMNAGQAAGWKGTTWSISDICEPCPPDGGFLYCGDGDLTYSEIPERK